MLDAIKRVISRDDMYGDGSGSTEGVVTPGGGVTNAIGTPPSNVATPPALVENDQEMDIDPDVAVTHISSALETPGSSLSEMSEGDSIHESGDRGGDRNMMDYMDYLSSHPMEMFEMNISNVIPEQAVADFARNDSKVSSDSSSTSMRGSSQNSSRDWGWFEDVHLSEHAISPHLKRKDASEDKNNKKKGKKGGRLVPMANYGNPDDIMHSNLDNEAAAMAVTAPTYVLEESLSSQKLWRNTAGNRPPQPVEERAFFEKMWAQNFARSHVEYQMPVEVLAAATPISLSPFADGNFDSARGNDLSNYNIASLDNNPAKEHDVAEATLVSRLNDPSSNHSSATTVEPHRLEQININRTVKGTGSDGDLTVMVKGDNVFGTTVSKSFARNSENGGPIVGVDTVNISVASYRVVESKKHGKYAQFLVIYREGSIRDTIGVWKRYSDFQELSKKVTQPHDGCAAVIANMSPLAVAEEHEVEHLPNAITSWRLLKKRQRWYRCLDAGYLSLKVFLLERFLHDILFESSSPNLLRDFVGVENDG